MLNRLTRIVTVLSFGFACGALALGDITEIAQFSGQSAETWEAFLNYRENPNFNESSPAQIMGGNALIFNDEMVIYEPSASATFGLGSSGSAQVSDGTQGMGLNSSSQVARIEFDVALVDFGAFWGAATGSSFGDPAVVALAFYGTDGGFLGNTQFQYSRSSQRDGLLEWHGWHSTDPIGAIEYRGHYVVNDGLQGNFVPEPASLGLLAAGGVVLLRRRR